MQRPASLSLAPRRSLRAGPAAGVRATAPGNRLGGPAGWLNCHSSTAARPLLCARWLLVGADGNDTVLEMIRTGVLPWPELPAGVELYDSYAEMAIANGVDPVLPTLVECWSRWRTAPGGAGNDRAPNHSVNTMQELPPRGTRRRLPGRGTGPR
ncbi:DUF6283 family protein [Streptomyces rubradiris]|uniref:DUF6283 family protein n=1 Tax=Streptomyces rubradiris TaxID=285531 RepID=UPI003F4CCE59